MPNSEMLTLNALALAVLFASAWIRTFQQRRTWRPRSGFADDSHELHERHSLVHAWSSAGLPNGCLAQDAPGERLRRCVGERSTGRPPSEQGSQGMPPAAQSLPHRHRRDHLLQLHAERQEPSALTVDSVRASSRGNGHRVNIGRARLPADGYGVASSNAL